MNTQELLSAIKNQVRIKNRLCKNQRRFDSLEKSIERDEYALTAINRIDWVYRDCPLSISPWPINNSTWVDVRSIADDNQRYAKVWLHADQTHYGVSIQELFTNTQKCWSHRWVGEHMIGNNFEYAHAMHYAQEWVAFSTVCRTHLHRCPGCKEMGLKPTVET